MFYNLNISAQEDISVQDKKCYVHEYLLIYSCVPPDSQTEKD